MRRLLPVVLAALLAALLLLPTGAAAADTAGTDRAVDTQDQLLLATEGEPQGPTPNPTTTNAPDDYEPPFLINAAVGLTALMVGLVVVLGGLYWLLVVRPRNAE